MTDLKDIKARLDAASPGPWHALSGAKQRAHEMRFGLPVSNAAFPMVLSNNEFVLGEFSAWTSDGDRALIVSARGDIERLLDEVAHARELLRAVLYDCDEEKVALARHYLTCVEAP
jgi:hypothetical protein